MKSFVEKGHVPTMQELRPFEKFFGEFIDRSKVSVPEIKLGATVDTAFDNTDVLKRVIKAIPVCFTPLFIHCMIFHSWKQSRLKTTCLVYVENKSALYYIVKPSVCTMDFLDSR